MCTNPMTDSTHEVALHYFGLNSLPTSLSKKGYRRNLFTPHMIEVHRNRREALTTIYAWCCLQPIETISEPRELGGSLSTSVRPHPMAVGTHQFTLAYLPSNCVFAKRGHTTQATPFLAPHMVEIHAKGRIGAVTVRARTLLERVDEVLPRLTGYLSLPPQLLSMTGLVGAIVLTPTLKAPRVAPGKTVHWVWPPTSNAHLHIIWPKPTPAPPEGEGAPKIGTGITRLAKVMSKAIPTALAFLTGPSPTIPAAEKPAIMSGMAGPA